MEQENLQQVQEDEIDLLELAGRLWQRRKFIIKAGIVGIVVGLVVAFSIPKEYSVTVTLSPESGQFTSGSLNAAASMLGLGDFTSDKEFDALNIALFPEIMASNPFALELYSMDVVTDDVEVMKFNEFIKAQRQAWWSWLIGLPFKAVGAVVSFIKGEDEGDSSDVPNPFRLSKEQTERIEAIKESMSAVVDKKTAVTTITVTLQDPLVAATVADSVVTKLQRYITEYRIKKAMTDYEYWEHLYHQRQNEYYEKQQYYAKYVDENKSLYTRKSMIEGDRLANDLSLSVSIYNQAASQLQLARAKIQEAKPVFAVVDPATVPVKASSPRKLLILVGFIFLACAGACAWVVFGENMWSELRRKSAAMAEQTPEEQAEQ